MRAIQFTRFGGPEVLSLVTDAPIPEPGRGHLRIRVRAAGVNPYDHKLRTGTTGAALTGPVIPGLEASGVVDELGAGVSDVGVGDEVFGLTSGGAAAEYAVLRAWALKPPSFSFAAAAGIAVAGETAVRVLHLLALQPGQVLLVHGASGGVGQAAVQLAREAGLRVIGTAGEANHDLLAELGAEPVTYGEGLVARVAALAPGGVDGVFDTAGTQLADLLAIAGHERIVTIANYQARAAGVQFSGGGGDARAALREV
ncbi:MAG: NADP-dependent oxidoreductase, partial [Propionibacteriaceae bacterium]|nr:NADP-dependent oxidoreductase [Propionibacteriaceae bacterium]